MTPTFTGRLTAIAPGAVTVTAACGQIVGSFTMQIVENARMPGTDYRYEFFHGKSLVLEQGSLAQDGIAINEALTNCTIDLGTAHGIAVTPCYPGMQVALDFYVPKSGFYAASCFGTTYSWGSLADVYMDDVYMGQMDFNQNRSYSYNAPGPLNTVWLDAGIHTIRLINVRSGYFYWGGFELRQAEDPGQIVPVPAAKTVLLVGETTEVSFGTDFYLKQVDTAPSDYTNYCILSSDSDIVTLDGTTVTAAKEGSATITLQGEIAGRAVSAQLPITVVDGSVHTAALSAQATTLAPTDEGVQLQLTCFGTDGSAVSLPSGASVSYESADTALATVDQKGFLTITGTEGSAEITVVITEGSRTVECAIWITVTAGKTEPTVYTYEERANALENVSKYAWAASEKNTAVSSADFVVEHLDTYYEAITHEGLPRSGRVGENGDPEVLVCRYCKVDLGAIYNHYPYIVDPINKPWKITCPECDRDFPSNDFESYYKSGLDEQGYFHPENADPQYLVNELYPEMGEGWGADDGFGYDTGNVYDNGVKEVHYYIAYYLGNFYFPLNASAAPYSLINALKSLRDAYLYTGDAVYGNAGAILLDRLGDVYPEMNHHDNSVSGDRGKIMDYIFEGSTIQQVFATCADAFWDCFDNAEVVEYLRARHTLKGIADPETITPETIRAHIDENILLAIRHAIENGQSHGNAGMSEAAMAYAAVALDRLPESKQMIDWIFRKGEVINVNTSTGEQLWTGGSVMHDLVSKVDRDGFGNEGAITYNRMWYQNYLKLADALSGYTTVQGADLWKNPKFLDLFIAMDKITVLGNWAILTGEAGHMQGQGYYPEVSALLELFANTTADQTAHAQAARILYTANGRKVNDLHGSIFTKDPESGIRDEILAIVSEQGEYSASQSNMLCGHGLAILRNGPEQLLNGTNNQQFSDFWMYFGLNGSGHGAYENLSLGIDAYGLSFTGSTGYPTVVNTYSADREHWMRRTLSHNTVMVNHASQLAISKNSFPLHFDDAGEVKLMDVDASHAYAETDIYRRTVVTVALENQQYYAVDFFRVLGGRDHVYSFHAHTMQTPETEGLNLIHQPMGTYAGADVLLGASYPNPYSTQVAPNVNPYGVSTAASWLDNVYRDSSPDGEFVIDFAIEDFADRATTPEGLGMQLRVLSREPLTEVAIADGHPSQNGLNPEYVKYALLRRSGGNDLDSLFTAVIEPYCTSPRVTDSCLVDVLLLDGEEELTDTAAAVKVTRADGREDFIVYATNPDCLYAVCGEDGTEKFRFRGFAGVCSYEEGLLVYAYGNEAVQVADVIEGALPKVTGKVTDFTEGLADTYSMSVSLDQTVTADQLKDHYIYVENDGEENGVYRIHGAQVSGTEAVLDLHTQSLARSYADEENMALGFVHNIEVGQSFTVPQSAEEIPSYCEHKNTVSTISYNGDRTHTVTKACTCGAVISETVSDCTDEDKDTKCDRCGGVIVTLEQVNISGSNMTLGNDLKINFMIKASTMGEGPYTVRVTQDGKEPVLLSPAKYNNSYYYVPYSVAAKEMADVLTAEVLDANGYVISKTYTRSVTAYAVSLLGGTTTKESLKKVVVDMLNYGTEAQKYFGYNEDTYANATVTEAQQEAYATKEITGEDTRVKGTNFYGSNLSLETSILMNIFFRNIDQADLPSLTATCTYTDYKGRTVTQDCTVEGYGKTMCKVVVDRIVLADSRCMVTVSLYKDGTQIGYGAESVESYVARSMDNAATGALNTAILKFADSAYAHLGGTYHD